MDGCLSQYMHGKTVKGVIGGVGIFLSLRNLKSLNSIEKIQPRIMVGIFNDNPSRTIISSYSPTNACDKTNRHLLYHSGTNAFMDPRCDFTVVIS